MNGSINDDDFQSTVVTWDNKPAGQDWFAVSLDQPMRISRVVFTHGMNFHDGGWFDTRGGKPRVEIQAAPKGAWQPLGELTDYPVTTATDSGGLKDGQPFVCKLDKPVQVYGVRVIGKPACGDSPKQAFSTCAELEAFAPLN